MTTRRCWACSSRTRSTPTSRPTWNSNFVRLWESVAEAPPVGTAARAGEMRGMVNMPNRRRRAAGCGVAVVGDAALALDPIWGTGCGFAMQSAAWLVDETAATLADRHSSPRALDEALERYRRAHVRQTRGHALHIEDFSRVRRNRLLETLLFSAATRDEALADTLLAYLGREDGLLDVDAPAEPGVGVGGEYAPCVRTPSPRVNQR